MILITGGSGSGKSEYAENLAVDINSPLLYIATMANLGKEAEERIARHRRQRAGKGFETLESMYLDEHIDTFNNRVVLLEDLSNLLSNYMFLKNDSYEILDDNVMSTYSVPKKTGDYENEVDIIYKKLIAIDSVCRELIIVTNEIFSDGKVYEQSVMDFIRNLANLNKRLAKISHQFTEVVYGIPVMIK